MIMKTEIFIVILGVSLVLTGCSDTKKSTPTMTTTRPQPRSTPTSSVAEPVAAEEPAPVYSYTPAGRRDPFTPIVIKEEKKGLLGAKTPLERFPISEFKLTGIIWGGMGYRAMLEGPDGKGYFVGRGTVIGPNRGVIKKITQKTMVVEETYKDPSGETNKKEIVIELRKKQEGTP
jgi:type IV pilus assembly protein PilP